MIEQVVYVIRIVSLMIGMEKNEITTRENELCY